MMENADITAIVLCSPEDIRIWWKGDATFDEQESDL